MITFGLLAAGAFLMWCGYLCGAHGMPWAVNSKWVLALLSLASVSAAVGAMLLLYYAAFNTWAVSVSPDHGAMNWARFRWAVLGSGASFIVSGVLGGWVHVNMRAHSSTDSSA